MSKSQDYKASVRRFSGMDTITTPQMNEIVKISGICKIPNDFECLDLSVSGVSNAAGNLTIHGNFRNSGMSKLSQNVFIEGNMSNSGTLNTQGSVLVGVNGRCSGIMKIVGDLDVLGGVKFSGLTRIRGNVQIGKKFDASGKVKIGGTIQTDELILHGGANVPGFKNLGRSEIGGHAVANKNAKIRNLHLKGNLMAFDLKIEKNVEIDGNVYYVNSLDVHDSAIIKGDIYQIPAQMFTTPEQFGFSLPPARDKSLPAEPVDVIYETVPDETKTGVNFCPQCGTPLEGDENFCPFCALELRRE